MGLSIVLFVPDGIVLATDGLSEVRNNECDQSFLHKSQKHQFVYEHRYVVSIQGSGFYKGLPYSYYANKIFLNLKYQELDNTNAFANAFYIELSKHIESTNDLIVYIAGIDIINNDAKPYVYIITNNKIQPINVGEDGCIVYNYHAIGQTYWINKLLLPSEYVNDTGDCISFKGADIDFSKFSLDEAIEFAETMIQFSCKMNYLTQLSQVIGEKINVCVLPIYGSIYQK